MRREYYYKPDVEIHFTHHGSLHSSVLFGPFLSLESVQEWQDTFLVAVQEKFGGEIVEALPPRQKIFAFSDPGYQLGAYKAGDKKQNFDKQLQGKAVIVKSKSPILQSEDYFDGKLSMSQPILPSQNELKDFINGFVKFFMDKRDEAFSDAQKKFFMTHAHHGSCH